MATTRSFPLNFVICLCALCAAPRLPASGGWFDESPTPLLVDELDRLPAKTLGEILLETVEKGKFEIAEIVEIDAVSDDEIKDVIDKIGKEKPEVLASEIDKLVMKARLQYVLKGGVLNVLYDIRDAITSKGPTDEQRKKYCTARLNEGTRREDDAEPATYAAGNPMRAHLLYQRGAMAFTAGEREKAQPWFEEILAKFPDHPRAETALFLKARCVMSQSWGYTEDKDKAAQLQKMSDQAESLYTDYLKKYPQGRYVADAHGWLGAMLWGKRPAEALEHYIAQLEDPNHPECRKSAAHMVEQVLAKVVGHPEENEAVLKVVAQHPRIAQAAVYLVLNAPEIDPYDGKYDEPADLKKWKLKVLPKLAALVSAEEARYQGDWALRMRAMLAQVASEAGKQEEALKLTDVPEADLKKSDDLLFARIVVLQRMKRPKDVAKAGKLFFGSFEKSQLSMGVALRLAQALVDDHRAGEAYVFLAKVEGTGNEQPPERGDEAPYPPDEVSLELQASGVYPDTAGGDGFAALKATILDFAPIKELEAVLEDKVWEEKADALGSLTNALMKRKAALEDYAGALKLGGDDAFKQQMEDFAELAKKVKNANGKSKAEAMMALGDAYEEAAGKGSNLNEEGTRGRDDLTRRDDAHTLGLADPDEELENQNLMRHATRWWLRAARTVPATELSAKARAKVLDGIERIARGSDYDFTRAMESNMAQASRDIYNVLQKESPKSAAARDAVYWDFVPCPKPKPKEKKKDDPNNDDGAVEEMWRLRGQEDPEREEDALSLLGGYHALHYNAFGEFGLVSESDGAPPSAEQTRGIPVKTAQEWEAIPLPELGKVLEECRKNAQSAADMSEVNFVEDLLLLSKSHELSHPTRLAYIEFRMKAQNDFGGIQGNDAPPPPKLSDLLAKARANPALASIQDFVDYTEIYVIQSSRGNGQDLTYPDYPEVEKACREFLAKYPKSLKRQAASLVLIRSLFRQLPDRFGHEGPGARHEHSVDDSRPVVELSEPFKSAALEKAMAAYEKEFPKPRYAAEMRNYRGIIAWRKFDYGLALELTIAQLDDESHPDLRMEAAVRLANIFADLRDAKHRTAVLTALKTRPAAVEKLKQYLDVAPKNAGHPLRCMGQFLRDRLGF